MDECCEVGHRTANAQFLNVKFNLTKVCFLLLAACLLFSCAKEDVSSVNALDETTVKTEKDGREITINDRPIKVNKILKFRDYEHFENYYLELDELANSDDEAFLSYIEENDEINSVYYRLLNDEFRNPEDRYQPFLTDPVMRSIVNQNYEFQIGEAILTYVNSTQILIANETDVAVRSQIEELPKGEYISLDAIPEGAYPSDIRDIDDALSKPWCDCKIKVEPIDCETYKVSGSCGNFVFGSGDGTVSIWITESSSTPVVNPNQVHAVNGSFEFIIEINPNILGFPDSEDTFFIHAMSDPRCSNGSNTRVFIEAAEERCDPGESTTGNIWTIVGGTQAIVHETSYFRTITHSAERGEVRGYHLDGNTWKNHKSELKVNIAASRKTKECGVFSTQSKTRNCGNCRSKSATVRMLNGGGNVHHCEGDVVGTYRKKKSGVTVNGTGSPDFDCCEL